MTIKSIRNTVSILKKKYPGMSAEEICAAEGIVIYPLNLGKTPTSTKGFYTVIDRMKSIGVNVDLPEWLQHIVVLHELGHATLHENELVARQFHDITFYDDVGSYEFEANTFAAEFALSDEEVFETLREYSFFDAAAVLNVPPELLDFKIRILRREGYNLKCPIVANSRFMKHIDRANRF